MNPCGGGQDSRGRSDTRAEDLAESRETRFCHKMAESSGAEGLIGAHDDRFKSVVSRTTADLAVKRPSQIDPSARALVCGPARFQQGNVALPKMFELRGTGCF